MQRSIKNFNIKIGKILFFCLFSSLISGLFYFPVKSFFDDTKNKNYYLYRAAKNGELDYVKKLVEKQGADVNYQTSTGNSVLMQAVKFERENIVNYLLSIKDNNQNLLVKVDLVNKHGQNALHKVAKQEETVIIKKLIFSGADKNKQDRHGDTPLHIAVRHGNLNIVKEFFHKHSSSGSGHEKHGSGNLGSGGSGSEKHSSGNLGSGNLGSGHDSKKIIKVNLGIKNKKGNTPLHEAALCNYKTIFDYLVKKGADTKIKNNCGKVPQECFPKYIKF